MSLRSIEITKPPPSTPIVSTAASDTRGRLIIAIEGNIGIGKSTLLANLRKHFALDESVAIVDEPVALWEKHGLLEAMYTDTLSRCAFQLMALTTRYTALMEALASKAKIIITERSIFSDRYCFAQVNLRSPADIAAYAVTHDALVASLPPDARLGTVLLQAPRNIVTARIAARGRAQEEAKDDGKGGKGGGIPDEYLASLDDAHGVYYGNCDPDTKECVDATQSRENVADAVIAAIDRIVQVAAPPMCVQPQPLIAISPVSVLDAMQVA